jgi:hypothetical protein
MRHVTEIIAVIAFAIPSLVACSSDESASAPADAGASEGARPHYEASAQKPDSRPPRAPHDASKPPHAPDSAPADVAAPRETGVKHDGGGVTPHDAGGVTHTDGGRPLSTDRNDFFGDSRCTTANVDLCEDFESGVLDPATWSMVGDPVIGGAEKARGLRALHISIDGNGPEFIRERKTFPAANNKYWGRIFVNFVSLPDVPMDYAHWTFIAASGTGVSGEIRVSGQRFSGNNWFGVGTDNRTDPEGTGDWTQSDDDPKGNPSPVPLHQWLCVEWLHDGSADETRFFLDGVEHPSLHTTATQNGGNGKPYLLPDFTNVWIGWQEYQTSTQRFELWVDEIAIDGDRIGCVI